MHKPMSSIIACAQSHYIGFGCTSHGHFSSLMENEFDQQLIVNEEWLCTAYIFMHFTECTMCLFRLKWLYKYAHMHRNVHMVYAHYVGGRQVYLCELHLCSPIHKFSSKTAFFVQRVSTGILDRYIGDLEDF